MIDLRRAVESAKNYFQSIQDLLGAGIFDSVRLEEMELSDDRRFWLVTLGYERTGTPDIFGDVKKIREYKQFKIDSETGQVEAMKIREV